MAKCRGNQVRGVLRRLKSVNQNGNAWRRRFAEQA